MFSSSMLLKYSEFKVKLQQKIRILKKSMQGRALMKISSKCFAEELENA
jgi:hypothetical protein